MLEENPTGKKLCMRWKDIIRKDEEALERGLDWKSHADIR